MTTYANIYKNISFGLYPCENLDVESSKQVILQDFKHQYETTIRQRLKEVGLVLKWFNYYSPKYYNYENDSLDTEIEVENKQLLKQAILNKQEQIQQALDKNKSYDGYIATTVKTVEQELENLKKEDYEPDVIVIRELLNLEIDKYVIYDNLKFEEED